MTDIQDRCDPLLAGQVEATVARLYEAGALQDETANRPALSVNRLQAEREQIRAAGVYRRRQTRRIEVEGIAAPT